MRMRDAVTGTMRMRGAGCGFPHLIFPILISGSFEIIIFFIHLLEVLKTNEVVQNVNVLTEREVKLPMPLGGLS